jgi:Rrf2 family protein
MMEIAMSESKTGVFQKDIARNQAISNKYLDQIIHALKAAKLIANARGKKSGYLLTRQPAEITIFDIHRAFEPGICIIECLSGHYDCDRRGGCLAVNFWENLNVKIIDYFKSVTLEDIINKGI